MHTAPPHCPATSDTTATMLMTSDAANAILCTVLYYIAYDYGLKDSGTHDNVSLMVVQVADLAEDT